MQDSKDIRRTTLTYGVSYFTTLAGARAAARAIGATRSGETTVESLQEYYAREGVQH